MTMSDAMCRKLDLMGKITSNATGRSRPKPVDHRIEKRPFNVCVLAFYGRRFSFTTQARPRETGRCVQWARDVSLLNEGSYADPHKNP